MHFFYSALVIISMSVGQVRTEESGRMATRSALDWIVAIGSILLAGGATEAVGHLCARCDTSEMMKLRLYYEELDVSSKSPPTPKHSYQHTKGTPGMPGAGFTKTGRARILQISSQINVSRIFAGIV